MLYSAVAWWKTQRLRVQLLYFNPHLARTATIFTVFGCSCAL